MQLLFLLGGVNNIVENTLHDWLINWFIGWLIDWLCDWYIAYLFISCLFVPSFPTFIPLVSSSSNEPISKASAALTSPRGGISGGGYFCK